MTPWIVELLVVVLLNKASDWSCDVRMRLPFWLHLFLFMICIIGTIRYGSGQIVRLSCRRTAVFELRRSNQKVQNGVLSRKLASSITMCNSACASNPKCEAINFKAFEDSGGKTNCELLSVVEGPEKWEEETGWHHYKAVSQVASRCYGAKCPEGHVCEETCENVQGFKCVELSPCFSSPCHNNGTCNALKNGFTCQCKQGYEGNQCELAQTCSFGCTSTSCSGLGDGTVFQSTGTGRTGTIQTYTVATTGVYLIKAAGAKGGSHHTNYGDYPGSYCGGNGAVMQGAFQISSGTLLSIVVGHRGGDSVEVKGGQGTTQTASSLGLSIEDNAGTGGGGGSFVYTSANVLLIAAGGGGGASAGWNGVDGSSAENGTDSVGKKDDEQGRGGLNGQPGQCCNSGNYHGGAGAGWSGQGGSRQGTYHGERGGSLLQTWVGGNAGGMNSGTNGGPAPGAVGGFGGGGGGSEDNGASGAGGGYSGGGSGSASNQAGGGGGSYCNKALAAVGSCVGASGGNKNHYGYVTIKKVA